MKGTLTHSFPDHCGIYRFERKLINILEREINPSGVHRYMRECIDELNPKGLGW